MSAGEAGANAAELSLVLEQLADPISIIWVGIIWHSAIPGRVTDIKQKMEENGMKTEVDLERQGIM